MFMSGAVFNLAVGLGLIFMLRWLQPYLGMAPVPANLNFFVDLVGMFICSFGVTYWLLARDFPKYRLFAGFGAACKILVVAIVAYHFLAGYVGWPLFILALIDLLYAVLFIRALGR
jgi:hypothetical protein